VERHRGHIRHVDHEHLATVAFVVLAALAVPASNAAAWER
jgi:hypothetical protein